MRCIRYFLCLLLTLLLPTAWSSDLNPDQITGEYHIANAERGQNQNVMQLAQYQGNTVIAVAACAQGCQPSIYTYLADESEQLSREVFRNSFGQYLLHYDGTTFVNVLPDQVLGENPWSAFNFINVYSQNKTTADQAAASMDTYRDFALGLSEQIMNQEVGPMAHGDGEYHFAVPRTHAGKQYNSRPITFHDAPEKRIEVAQCPDCGVEIYHYLSDESAILGVPAYREGTANSRRYLFDLKDGVLLWARYGRSGEGLGESLWGEQERYNVFARDKNYVRQLISDSAKQQALDDLLVQYSRSVKDVFDERQRQAQAEQVATQTLPAAGLDDTSLEAAATEAAGRWAKAYNWREAIKYAYFTGDDWATIRHPLSGIITGRAIDGVVVMEREDGLCSYHHVSFAQDYNGSAYTNVAMTGLVPGQIKLQCDKT